MKLTCTNYFNQIPINLIEYIDYQQDIIKITTSIPSIVTDFFYKKKESKNTHLEGVTKNQITKQLFFNNWIDIESEYIDKEKKIYIGKGVKIEPGVMIKQNTIIFEKCELRTGSYIRENSIICENCIIGNSSEIKHSILFEKVEAGHFNYIGDSIIGNYVNFGAGVKLANLEFRSLQDKKNNNFPIIKLPKGIENNQEITKIGAVVGDGCEIGCNAVISPASFLGKECSVLPNICVSKGIYSSRVRIK